MFLELAILWKTDEGQQLENAGLEIDTTKHMTTKQVTFLRIDAIYPCIEWGKERCIIIIGETKYITEENHAFVCQKIRDQQVFKFN